MDQVNEPLRMVVWGKLEPSLHVCISRLLNECRGDIVCSRAEGCEVELEKTYAILPMLAPRCRSCPGDSAGGTVGMMRLPVHPPTGTFVLVATTSRSWSLSLPAEFGHADITADLQELIRDCGVTTGIVVVSLVGSTGAVTTIEYEPGALEDLRRALERLSPRDEHYQHDARWGDGNGFSHVRSAALKTSMSLPITDGELQVGTWQQVVALNLDNRPRNRTIVACVVGD